MRTTDRDRCRSAVASFSAAFILIILLTIAAGSAAIPEARYTIFPNGSAYEAAVTTGNVTGYEFYETGPLGERVPIQVTNVSLSGNCTSCTFNWTNNNGISFPAGSYTIHYQGPIRDNHLQGTFDQPYWVEVVIPGEYDVRNPLLGVISPGGQITPVDNSSISVVWNGTRSFELRFYDQERESLLYLFGNFWIIIAVVLLLPFVMTWRRKKKA